MGIADPDVRRIAVQKPETERELNGLVGGNQVAVRPMPGMRPLVHFRRTWFDGFGPLPVLLHQQRTAGSEDAVGFVQSQTLCGKGSEVVNDNQVGQVAHVRQRMERQFLDRHATLEVGVGDLLPRRRQCGVIRRQAVDEQARVRGQIGKQRFFPAPT